MSTPSLKDTFLAQVVDLLRETFEGGLPGQGTQYLDHSSGIRSTLRSLTAEQASQRLEGHPSIAAHARHMSFHLRVTSEWILGDHSRRDWVQSFEPQTVNAQEWDVHARLPILLAGGMGKVAYFAVCVSLFRSGVGTNASLAFGVLDLLFACFFFYVLWSQRHGPRVAVL